MKPITGLVLGTAGIAFGLWAGLAWVPSSIADLIEYGKAGACKEPVANGSGCWTEVSAVITGTHVFPHARGNSTWVVDLTDKFGAQRPKVAHRSVFNRLASGQPVTVRFWKGWVAIIHIPGGDDLPTDQEPGRQLGIASLTAIFTLLAGLVIFLGGLGVHRHAGSWTRSVAREDWSNDLFDLVAPPARLWFQATVAILFVSLGATTAAWIWFDVPLLPAAAVSLGLAALAWAWLLHHRARAVMPRMNAHRKTALG
jgi:hypothetical protein